MTSPKRPKKNEQSTTLTQKAVAMPVLPFPHEIMVEILSRLPVKSLVRFRCVCKSWRALISDPHFVQKHLDPSTNDSEDFTRWRVIRSSVSPFSIWSCSLYSVFCDPSVDVVDLDYPSVDPDHCDWVVGSCNGLLCVAIGQEIVFLWNPSIRESKRLPHPGTNFRVGRFVVYGFGYDRSIDDYKVVGVFCDFVSGGSYETEVKVCTLRTNSWRRIQNFPYGVPHDESGKHVNGALHWAAGGDSVYQSSWIVVSLDLSKETYGEVPQPNYGDGGLESALGVLGGCLCVLRNKRGIHADVWVMKEYGVKESWIKLVTIPYLADPGLFQYSAPLCLSKNGEILLEFGSNLVLYNSRDKTFRYPKINIFGSCLDVNTYVESLVSPKR